jgi:GDPmannose 4,6-dehydratase
VTRKIVAAACRIAAGKQRKLHLGDITIQRDWGWAPEYVEAMWMLLQQSEPDDYVIATGEAYKLEQFVELAFSLVKLDWRDHVVVGATPARPTDLSVGRANPAKAKRKLGWQAKYKMPDVARMMVEAELELQSG